MVASDGGWVALFSGGKDSSWALYRALEAGRDVRRLVAVRPPEGSHTYHAPATSVARLAARSIGIPTADAGLPTTDIEPPDLRPTPANGVEDLEPLEVALERLDDAFDGGLEGVVAGVVESEFQADRLRSLCDGLGCDFLAPLWRAEPRELATAMIDGGLGIVIVEVSAPGFDADWLGRRLDRDALADLEAIRREHGTHLLGEDGEFETIVIDGPHMTRSIALEFEREWNGEWGRLRITDARLE
ncbi:universal metal-binding-domain/4Fe-4S-binding-domain containing ABC transporter protein [Natronococcus amylolyticus DSM 10524]|uniref:Universal metal-binding-domain/4Fe-4S-binding-domain containing ABC transporter protein n=1 Tax=Natronococcus amylolyticus DSM 10524 TaxID=1227497 RepID=L9X302_9EURY|nr:diphthine--ammonia ligase [Natronococcus amylolyticus]ELY56085.1 universal metal-binding-domain/4Fe-4S-binding-domain containing ABC transporter protein [Natronococcus amylolyticus DSM 10524]